MYVVKQDGTFAGYADSIVPIRLHGNGCYVPCEENQAEGFFETETGQPFL